MKLGIAGVVLSMFDRLNNHYSTAYNGDTEVLTISQPDLGPKSLDVGSHEIENFVGVLVDFDPNDDFPLAEIVRRTLECVTVKGEKIYRFRTSLKAGTRAVSIPASEWPDFVRWWEAAADSVPATIEQYQALNSAARAAASSGD